ncbi:LPXTG cell wall anchor domain-containing protein [Spirillospora sp. NBC_00431]
MPHSIRRVQVPRVRRLALAVLAACVALFAAPGLPAARADVNPVQLADALTSYNALYVATGTGKWETDPALDYLRKAMSGQKLPVYVMVLPKSKDLPDPASQDDMLRKVAKEVGRSGTYVLLTGTSLRAHSTSLSPATTEKLIEQATSQGGKDRLKVMGNLIRAAGTAPQETSAPGRAANGGRYIPPVKKEDSGSTGTILIVAGIVVVAALAAAGAFLFLRRKKNGPNGNGAAKPGTRKHAGKPGTPAAPKPTNGNPANPQATNGGPGGGRPDAAKPANGRPGGGRAAGANPTGAQQGGNRPGGGAQGGGNPPRRDGGPRGEG